MRDGSKEQFRRLAPTALAELLDEEKDQLLEKWARRVLGDPRVPSAEPLSELALYDHFPAIVDRIVKTLRTLADHPEELGKIVGEASEARDHVRDRAEADYSVPEVLRELSHLRLSILDACEERGAIPDRASAAILHSAFDQMMINAAEELSRLELEARRRAEALARERAELYERERAAREASEDAHRAKDQFLAMVSHELRTPLNAIAGWSQMLKVHDGDPVVHSRAIDSIQRNAEAQAQLITGVLDVSRLASGRVALDRVAVDPASVLRSVIESFSPAVLEKNLHLETAIPHVAPPVLGDALRLRQILTNLVGNAVKFTPEGGSVRVTLSIDADIVCFDVCDTGVGIPSDFLPHVFEPFRQADASWTREHGGLGLGMAIAKALVELHGGTIGVTSGGRGHGATFRVCLPAADDASRASQPASEPNDTLAGHALLAMVRVLVVDDAEDSRELATAILTRERADVRAAASAEEALEVIRRGFRPHVLVADLAMPGEDGFSLLHRVRQDHGWIPALALSAFTAAADLRRAAEAGFERYVPKPVVIDDLLSAVRELSGEDPHRDEPPSAEATTKSEGGDESMVALKRARRSVLIVEDDPSNATELARRKHLVTPTLQRAAVVTASTAQNVVEVARVEDDVLRKSFDFEQ
jgi:signal transduction histidine kinase/CheY-like chemotaxis protein